MNQDYVPIVSLRGYDALPDAAKAEISTRVDRALRTSGFFICTDHGVPAGVLDKVQEEAYRFFDRPLPDKLKSQGKAAGSPRGYIPYGVETLSATDGKLSPPDIKEGYGVGPYWVDEDQGVDAAPQRPATYTRNVWPSESPEFQAAVLGYYRQMEALTLKLMELFAFGMKLPPAFFVDKFKKHNSTLRLIHYPPQDNLAAPGQLRAGAHTDYGALTILYVQDKQGGLQVKTPGGEWVDVVCPPGAFVINIGDLMMNWSNDKWLSNYHRVVNPPSHAGASARRLSMAYFCNPQDDLPIECLPTCCSESSPAKYAPILAGEHRLKKIRLSQLLTANNA